MTARIFEPSVPKAIWGPSAWMTLHSFASAYTPERKSEFLTFIHAFGKTLPCSYCIDHFQQKLKELPPDKYMGSAEDLLFWTYTIHDMANRDITRRYFEAQQAGLPFSNTPKVSPPWGAVRRYYLGR